MGFLAGIIFLNFIYQTYAVEENIIDYEYEHLTDPPLSGSVGLRLVGASRGDIQTLSFLVGFNVNFNGQLFTDCTGSLITRSWVLTAAHCIIKLVPLAETKKCLALTRSNKYYHNPLNGRRFECSYLPRKNLKIKFMETPAFAFFGISDFNAKDDTVSGDKFRVDFVIRHANTYHGGGYGLFGGYDIAMFHMASPVPRKYKPACLPSIQYKDTGIGRVYDSLAKANLAGFGLYRRKPCITDKYGPSKFLFCRDGSSCSNDKPPEDPACNSFFNHKSTPNSIPGRDDELMIVDKGGSGSVHKCFRSASPEPGSKGWCPVTEDASTNKAKHSWGFCSKDCYLDEQKAEPDISVLRKVQDITVLDEKLCDQYLNDSLGFEVEVRPEILCIGKAHHLSYTVWHEEGNGYRQGSKSDVQHPLTKVKGGNFYVTGAGSCNGDSGGPVFTYDETSRRFIVFGSVSGERGEFSGNCGGMNNPTHYVRLKKFGIWIELMLAEDARELCFI